MGLKGYVVQGIELSLTNVTHVFYQFSPLPPPCAFPFNLLHKGHAIFK